MRKGTRLVALLSAIALGLAFVLPLWKITLEAPQYPEGIGMRIWVNTIVGATPHDLQNINGLNHYVGMARIEPDSFAELRWMPWILGGLIVLGLSVAATGSRKLLIGWAGVFALSATAGLIDFYRWEYEYGHNLDPQAAIKVPGLAYQPPLIGSKKLLNFTAHSWPDSGGWLAITAFGAVAIAAVVEVRRKKGASAVASGERKARVETAGGAEDGRASMPHEVEAMGSAVQSDARPARRT